MRQLIGAGLISIANLLQCSGGNHIDDVNTDERPIASFPGTGIRLGTRLRMSLSITRCA